MGLRGPAPTPIRILELRGSPRAGLHPAAPSPPAKRPPPPKWLKGEARKIYKKTSGHLHAMGVLAAVDQNALARYASNFALWLELQEYRAKHGTTYAVFGKPGIGEEKGPLASFKMYPQMKAGLSLEEHLVRAEREFGMSPASRARLVAGNAIPFDDGCGADFAAG